MYEPIYTKRLVLRKFTEDDLTAVFQIFSDEKANEFLPWFPLKSFGEANHFFERRFAEPYRRGQAYQYAVCLRSDDIPVGYINISPDESHDLGYGLREEFWNRGIMTEAGKSLLKTAKADGIPYITATHDRNNPQSGRVMQKLGMKYQYSYEELWQPKNKLAAFRLYLLNLDGIENRFYSKYWDASAVHYVENIQ